MEKILSGLAGDVSSALVFDVEARESFSIYQCDDGGAVGNDSTNTMYYYNATEVINVVDYYVVVLYVI